MDGAAPLRCVSARKNQEALKLRATVPPPSPRASRLEWRALNPAIAERYTEKGDALRRLRASET
jgi:hypothetical protein